MRPSVVVIGNFDGVHMGHQALLAQATERALQLGDADGPADVIAITFWPHPMSVVAPDRAPKLLCTLPDRIALLKSHGVREVRVVQFNREVAGWAPERFVKTIIEPLNPVLVVVGENFRFGKGASGNAGTIREVAAGRYQVEESELMAVGSTVTSSSVIRKALVEGDVASAATNLGRWFRVRGLVVVGDQRGRTLGFPTANLPVSSAYAVPADGVYAGWLSRDDDPEHKMPAVISVGTNPTFDGVERRVETNVLDRDDLALYGIEIAVDFVEHLRGQMKFDGPEGLVTQMHEDVARTRQVLDGLT